MAITKSWERSILFASAKSPARLLRRPEFYWLLGGSLLVASGLALVCVAKTQRLADAADQQLLNLNTVTSSEQIVPFLFVFPDSTERQAIAEKMMEYLESHHPVSNVGALGTIRVGRRTLRSDLRELKPLFAVRTLREFLRQYVLWCLLYLASFWAVHVLWRWRRFQGDQAILPALHLLTGIGLILAVSLRDPLRDTLEFSKFAWGVALGCALLLLPLLRAFHYQRFSRWTYTPLLASFALFLLLLWKGSGPTGSDAKVNLGPFQPVELIKILVVLFLAGYFARKWEWLRELNEKTLLPHWLRVPRPSHALPVMFAVGGALLLFFVLKDLGPALVIGLLFLTMFSVARNRAGLALAGLTLLVVGVAAGYHYGAPKTLVDRVSMWMSPWDNDVRGGDQLAHSLWAFSTGGPWGSGPGWGDPGMIPAGHTDLVLSAIGEEWGFAGVSAVFLLFVLLLHRAFRVALRAPDEYAFFLALGLGTLVALEMLFISGGVLGAIPLSGVVSPFLSSGNTAMLSNFLIFAMLLGISNQPPRAKAREALPPLFMRPVRTVGIVLAVLGLSLVARASWFEMLHDQEYLLHDTRVFEEDGVKRPQHNPRLNSLAREIPRGNIYDRNGKLLATSSWNELERHRAEYSALGISIDEACSRNENRHYPFGSTTVHLLGDLRTGENFHAGNASLIEHDLNSKLQGFSTLAELGPLVRYRHQKLHPGILKLLAKDRDVHTSVDIRLAMRLSAILRKRLEPGKKNGAAVVLDAQTGDVLAMASFPVPVPGSPATPDQLLNRALYGQYPPGSTFKLVTAIAALRLDPALRDMTYRCERLGHGRVGTVVRGWNRPIRDDIGDSAHGTLNMLRALTVSCNAYFAQLGTYAVGARALHDTAEMLGIPAGEIPEIQKMMPFAAYGQGPVLITPFKMARVAAAIAAGGLMSEGRWVIDDANTRDAPPQLILPQELAAFLGSAMRSVVTGGTGRRAMAGLNISVAGKTGTAQVAAGAPHSWFTGYAPYGDAARQVAFAVVVEHGGYGAQFAAPMAREIVEAARDLGIIAADSISKR